VPLAGDCTVDRVIIATCCTPRSSDPIVVYVSKSGNKATAHQSTCAQLSLYLPETRQYAATWSVDGLPAFVALSAKRTVRKDGFGMAWLEEIQGTLNGLGISARLTRLQRTHDVASVHYLIEWPGDRLIDAAVDSLAGLQDIQRVDVAGRNYAVRRPRAEGERRRRP
jgi:(p)ppGpp synthase/HD superfamily hydrolase